MNTKHILFAIATLVLLFAVSCQRDELQGGSLSGEEVTVGISAVMPLDGGAVVKSNAEPGNGSEVNRCIMQVYLADDTDLSNATEVEELKTVEVTDGKASFGSLQLVAGHTYCLVLWADCATKTSGTDGATASFSDLYYNTGNYPEVSFKDGVEYAGNDDSRDAFFASYKLKVDGPSNHTVELHRPFGQLNIIANDYGIVEDNFSTLLPTQVKIEFANIPSGINLLTGDLTEAVQQTLTSGPVAIANVTPAATDGSRQLSFDYIFAPQGDDQLVLEDFKMFFLDNAGAEKVSHYIFQNIPVKRNYQTNVSGALLTDRTGIDIEVVPDFNDPDLDKDAELLKLMKVLEEGGSYTLQEDVEITEALVVNGNVTATIDLNGCNIINTTSVPDAEAPQYGNTTVFELDGNAVLNIEGDGDIHAISTKPDEDGYRMAVYAKGYSTVNIYGGNYLNDQDFNDHKAQLDLIYADQNATINIYGGRFESKCANDRGYWVLNLKDDAAGAAINVYGGTFVNFDPSSSLTENPVKNFVAEGSIVRKVSDSPAPNGTYEVYDPEEIETAEAFLDALANEEITEITVSKDLDLSSASAEQLIFTDYKLLNIPEGVTVKMGKNFLEAQNGLTLMGDGTIDNTTDQLADPSQNPGYQKSLIHVKGGDLIIDGVTLINDLKHHWHGSKYNSAAIAYWNDADVTIRNAHVKSGEFTVCGMGRTTATGTITIEDSYFESTSTNKDNGQHWAYAMRLFGSKIRLDNCEVKGVQGGVSIEGCQDAEIISGKYYTVNTPGNRDAFYPLYVTNGAVVVVSGGEFSAANDMSGGLDIGGTSAVVSGDNDVNLPFGSVILKGGKFSGKAYNHVTKEVYQPAEGYVYRETGDDEYPWEVVSDE